MSSCLKINGPCSIWIPGFYSMQVTNIAPSNATHDCIIRHIHHHDLYTFQEDAPYHPDLLIWLLFMLRHSRSAYICRSIWVITYHLTIKTAYEKTSKSIMRSGIYRICFKSVITFINNWETFRPESTGVTSSCNIWLTWSVGRLGRTDLVVRLTFHKLRIILHYHGIMISIDPYHFRLSSPI